MIFGWTAWSILFDERLQKLSILYLVLPRQHGELRQYPVPHRVEPAALIPTIWFPGRIRGQLSGIYALATSSFHDGSGARFPARAASGVARGVQRGRLERIRLWQPNPQTRPVACRVRPKVADRTECGASGHPGWLQRQNARVIGHENLTKPDIAAAIEAADGDPGAAPRSIT